jgi:hypothetical protein
MRRELLGIAFAGVCWLTSVPVEAATYTYDVSMDIGGTQIAGNIQTNCDNCLLTPSTLVSFLFTDAGGSLSSSSATFQANQSNLEVTPTKIVYDATGSYFNSGFYNGGSSDLDFANFYSSPGEIDFSIGGIYNFGYFGPSLTIASVTPIPGTLPLFASAVVLLGMIGWRMKRKGGSAIAAA